MPSPGKDPMIAVTYRYVSLRGTNQYRQKYMAPPLFFCVKFPIKTNKLKFLRKKWVSHANFKTIMKVGCLLSFSTEQTERNSTLKKE